MRGWKFVKTADFLGHKRTKIKKKFVVRSALFVALENPVWRPEPPRLFWADRGPGRGRMSAKY